MHCLFTHLHQSEWEKEWEMLRQLKSVWVIVNIDLLCIPLLLPLLAGYNRCIWGKKIIIIIIIIKIIMCCSRKVVCSFTQARTDWQLPLAEPLPITSIDQSFRHDSLWVTSPPNTNTPHSIVGVFGPAPSHWLTAFSEDIGNSNAKGIAIPFEFWQVTCKTHRKWKGKWGD